MSNQNQKQTTKLTIEDLNKLYKEADAIDKEVFADQRSNLQLVSGEHYNRRNSMYWDRVRESKNLTNDQKMRLTKNHIYKISKVRKNIILSHASGVRVQPNKDSELQHQKAAELNQAVWEYGKLRQNIRRRTHEWVSEYFDVGEVCCKLYFDPNAGKFVGYEQAVDEQGQPMVDPQTGQPAAGEKGVFSGDIIIEKVYGFNLLRHPSAKTMDESPVLIIRKTVIVDELSKLVGDDEEKKKFIEATKDDTYVIFDAQKQSYDREKGLVTLREYYYKPCPEYPQGYFYITTESGVLWQGELPFGIFPIVYEGHDEVPTSPRHKSPIKQLRPYQIEINRAASKVAEHHVTLGDDKLVLINGSKVTKGSDFPGVRTMTVTGQAPVVVQGRSGEQYFPYIAQQITELYQVADVPEELEEKQNGDPWAELFKAARHKKKFIIDSERFEFFLKKVCETYLELAKNYFDESMLINAVGKSEMINIAEFKNTKSSEITIKVEPMNDDMETVMGKQLMLNHILQYSSGQLQREDIGKLIRMMPYANLEKSFDDFTLDYDRGTNMILALDRGEAPVPYKYDNGPYMIKRLTHRMSQGDFLQLPPEIQANYEQTVSLYEQLEAEKQRQLQAAEADFIPTGGANIKVAWYVKDPTNPARSIQATLPAQAIEWLVQRLEDQGSSQQTLLGIGNEGALSEIAQKFNQMQGQQAQAGMQGNQQYMPMSRQGADPRITAGGIQ